MLIPLALHSAVTLLCSIFIFPQSISTQFTRRLQNALVPIASALDLHQTILKTPHDSPEFISLYNQISGMSGKSEDMLILLRASARLLKSDLVYSRFAPTDFIRMLDRLPRQIGRMTGMAMYFGFLDPTREKFSVTPMPSLPGSPSVSRSSSPRQHSAHSIEEVLVHQHPMTRRRGHRTSEATPTPTAAILASHPNSQHSHSHPHQHPHSHPHQHSHSHPHQHSHSHPHQHSHSQPHSNHHSHHHPHSHPHHSSHRHYQLLHLKRSTRHEHAVGMFETQRYLNLEATHLHIPLAEVYTRQALDLVQERYALSCRPSTMCRCVAYTHFRI
jgi:hypothetical protein